MASNCSGTASTTDRLGHAGAVTTVHWTPPTTVPAGGVCTETLTITDNSQGSVTAYLAIQIQTARTASPS